ncbi:hypothetical protein DZF95_01535 [Clavibacter michiganensis]|nr:hypothetical protein DZF95_01535 [Clavibacter michiganensis]
MPGPAAARQVRLTVFASRSSEALGCATRDALRDMAMVSAGFYRNYSWAGTSAAMEGADDVDA